MITSWQEQVRYWQLLVPSMSIFYGNISFWGREITTNHHSDTIWASRRLLPPATRIFCSTVCSGQHRRKIRITGPLWGKWPRDSVHKGPVMRKAFALYDVIMFTFWNLFFLPAPRCWRHAADLPDGGYLEWLWRPILPPWWSSGWRLSRWQPSYHPVDRERRVPWYQGSWGQHGAYLGPTGPRWAPCWPHERCYQGWYSL